MHKGNQAKCIYDEISGGLNFAANAKKANALQKKELRKIEVGNVTIVETLKVNEEATELFRLRLAQVQEEMKLQNLG